MQDDIKTTINDSNQREIERKARLKVKEFIRQGYPPDRIATEINLFLQEYDSNTKLFY